MSRSAVYAVGTEAEGADRQWCHRGRGQHPTPGTRKFDVCRSIHNFIHSDSCMCVCKDFLSPKFYVCIFAHIICFCKYVQHN